MVVAAVVVEEGEVVMVEIAFSLRDWSVVGLSGFTELEGEVVVRTWRAMGDTGTMAAATVTSITSIHEPPRSGWPSEAAR